MTEIFRKLETRESLITNLRLQIIVACEFSLSSFKLKRGILPLLTQVHILTLIVTVQKFQ